MWDIPSQEWKVYGMGFEIVRSKTKYEPEVLLPDVSLISSTTGYILPI